MSANWLLRALKPADLKSLSEDFETVELKFKESLHEPGDPTPYVYFPDDGVVSLLTVLENGMAVELGHVGREGMVDISVFLGLEASESRIIIQVPGFAQRMASTRFRSTSKPCLVYDGSWAPTSWNSSPWSPRRPPATAITRSSNGSPDGS